MPVTHDQAMAALWALMEYLKDRSDVVDGDYGEPAPNEEMRLLGEIDCVADYLEERSKNRTVNIP